MATRLVFFSITSVDKSDRCVRLRALTRDSGFGDRSDRTATEDLIGLSLQDAQAMTGAIQRATVEAQAREVIDRGSTCRACQQRLRRNGEHRVGYRTPFGRLDFDSPRFYRCRCQTHTRQSVSPLAIWLGGHVSPELQCCRSGPACSISSCAVILSAGTRASSPCRSRFVWRRSTRNGPPLPEG
jgi:hypothetical protein